MIAASTIHEVREALASSRCAGKTIGLVPTMGALHRGHLSLIERARPECDVVVVSIFVNPAQFGPAEDLAQYPRTLAEDLGCCRAGEVDAVFHPSEDEIYPEGCVPWLTAGAPGRVLCGRFRPGHFDGVCQVVAKLFNIIQPDRAYFGQKDAQQLIVIRNMVAALDFPVAVVGCPTWREADGLALSSRNRYLSPAQRRQATVIYRSLRWLEEAVGQGRRDAENLVAEARDIIAAAGPCEIQYVELVDAESLEPWSGKHWPVLAAVAVSIGSCRLIDNLVIDANPMSG